VICIVKLEDLLSRADEFTLEEILGSQTIRLLKVLNSKRPNNSELKKIILDLYGAEGLLLNKEHRSMLFELLRENEARLLCQILGLNDEKSIDNFYEKLKSCSFRRGSKREESLFRFFNLLPPIQEKEEQVSSFCVSEGSYQLFDHQRDAVKRVKKLLNQYPHRVLLHMPTGSGKTRTTMNIIAEHLRDNEPTVVVWLAASEELCEQAAEEFIKAWSFLGNRPVSIYRFWGSRTLDVNSIKDGFVIAGLPKIVRTTSSNEGIRFISQLASRCSLVIMDEAHQAVAPTYKLILDSLFYGAKESKLLGLSATPGRTWNDIEADRELADFFSRKKVKLEIKGYSNPIDYLIAEGYLAKVTYRNLIHENDEVKFSENEINNSADIPLHVLKMLGEDEKRNLKMIDEAEQLLKRHNRVILFAPSVHSSNVLATVLRARGHIAYSVTGETDSNLRKKIIEDFKNDDSIPKIICNYGVLTTGFDAPKTSAAIIGRPTFSLVLYSQMVGRAIRGYKAGGNHESEVVTIIDQGLPGFRTVAESFENWEDVWE
jgi:DNA repair protein RadD